MSHDGSTRARVIWLHGFRDSGDKWSILEDRFGKRMPWVSWIFPDAEDRPLTCEGGMEMSSWFDIQAFPIQAMQHHDGLEATVAEVHQMLRDAEDEGIPSNRIVLGGWSLGGCVALHAGLTAERTLAGICCLSGWVAQSTSEFCQGSTPVLWCHGTADRKVPLPEARRSVEALEQAGCSAMQFTEYPGLPHGDSPDELEDVVRFLSQVLALQCADDGGGAPAPRCA